jgi:hypothetical protein
MRSLTVLRSPTRTTFVKMQKNYAGFATEGIESDIKKFLLKYRKEDFAILLPPRKCDGTATELF